MTLVAATLAVGLANVFRSQPVIGADAANKIANEYDTYSPGIFLLKGSHCILPASKAASTPKTR